MIRTYLYRNFDRGDSREWNEIVCDRCQTTAPVTVREVRDAVSFAHPPGWGRVLAGRNARDLCPACAGATHGEPALF